MHPVGTGFCPCKSIYECYGHCQVGENGAVPNLLLQCFCEPGHVVAHPVSGGRVSHHHKILNYLESYHGGTGRTRGSADALRREVGDFHDPVREGDIDVDASQDAPAPADRVCGERTPPIFCPPPSSEPHRPDTTSTEIDSTSTSSRPTPAVGSCASSSAAGVANSDLARPPSSRSPRTARRPSPTASSHAPAATRWTTSAAFRAFPPSPRPLRP